MDSPASRWACFMQAALTGLLAAEGEDFRFPHKADAAKAAANVADFATAEYNKRFKEDGQTRGVKPA